MLIVFMLPAIALMIGHTCWEATARSRELNRLIRASVRKARFPARRRGYKWVQAYRMGGGHL